MSVWFTIQFVALVQPRNAFWANYRPLASLGRKATMLPYQVTPQAPVMPAVWGRAAIGAREGGLRDVCVGLGHTQEAEMRSASCPLGSPGASGADAQSGAVHAMHNVGDAAKSRRTIFHLQGLACVRAKHSALGRCCRRRLAR